MHDFVMLPNWHPALVHFTVALTVTSGILFVCAGLTGRPSCRIAAFLDLWLAALSGLLTAWAGWDAYHSVEIPPQHQQAVIIHQLWAWSTLGMLLIAALWAFIQGLSSRGSISALAGLMLVCSVLVTITAWHGSELVYRYGIGVIASSPPGPAGGEDPPGGAAQ